MGPRQQNINEPTTTTTTTTTVMVGQSKSIALLQERFKQLERVKQMREERELQLRRDQSSFVPALEESTDSWQPSTDRPSKHQQQPNWPLFLHTELLRPSSPLLSVPSSAGPSYSTVGFFRHDEITSRPPPSMHNWNTTSTVAEPADIVDTSLHL